MIEVKEVLSERKYVAGYVVRKEIWDGTLNEDIEIKAAYNPDGVYIGDSKTAYRFCKTRGIAPEKREPDNNICSIGFCEKEQKWYGWSHRALYGFGIGSSTKKGDCSYSPTDKDDFLEDMVRFWTDEDHLDIAGRHGTNKRGEHGVFVDWVLSDKIANKRMRGTNDGNFQQYPETYGNGEWTAKTLEDAKQMACDFAEGVG